MSNPARAISKQWKRSTKDVSDEWKRNNTLRNVVYGAAVATGAYFAAPLLAGGGAAASGTGGAGAAAGAGSMNAAAAGAANSAAAAAGSGGGFLGAVGGGAAKIGGAVASGASKVGGFIGGADPMVQGALIQTGGAMLAGAMAPEEQRQDTAIEQMREQRRLRDADVMPALGGGGYLGAGAQPSGAYTTPRPIQLQTPMGQNYAQASPQMPNEPDVGHWDTNLRRWVQG